MKTTVYRPVMVSFRVSVRQYRRLRSAARRQDKPLSEFLRNMVDSVTNGVPRPAREKAA